MNPLLGLLGAYGVNKATGLGDRMTGLLDNVVNMFSSGAPVEDRNPPGGAMTQAASPRPVNTSPMIPVDQTINMADPGNAGIAQDMAGFAQQQAKSPTREYIDAETTAPVTSEEVDEVIKTAAQNVQQREADPEYGRYLSSLVSDQGVNSPEVQEFNAEKALASLWDQTLGNEEWRLRKAMVLNSMRLNPDSTLTAAFADRIKTLRKRRGANAMADRLEKIDAKKYSALITGLRNGDLEAKDVISTLYKNPTKFEAIRKMWASPEGRKELTDMIADGINPFGGTTINMGDKTSGLTKFNEKMAGEVYGWLGGGAGNLKANLANLSRAQEILQSGENVSGAAFGLLPEQGFNLFAPNAKIARDNVRSVVQGTLRETLGAQFTQKEGEGIMDRAYDPALPEEENKKRIAALFMKLSEAAQAKTDMMNYYINNDYNMRGFVPKAMPTIQDYIDAMNAAAPRKTKYIEPEATKPKVKKITEVK